MNNDLWEQFDKAYDYAQSNIDNLRYDVARKWLETMKDVAEQLDDSMTSIQIQNIEEQL